MGQTKLKRIASISILANIIFIFLFGLHFYRKEKVKLQYQKEAPGWYYKNNKNWKERVTLFQILPKEPNAIIFLGNSITEGCEWNELFQNEKIKNRGIGGDNTEGVLARINEITDSKPAKIFIEIGTNDLALRRSIANIRATYLQIITQIQKSTPNTKIYVQNVLPRRDDPNSRGEVSKDSIIKLNIELRKISISNNLTYINLFDVFKNPEGKLDARFSYDGVHLNGSGYLLWKKAIEKFVNN